jgi:hypothetical protein
MRKILDSLNQYKSVWVLLLNLLSIAEWKNIQNRVPFEPACRVSVLSQHVVRVACRGDVTCVTYVVGVDVRTVT